MSAAPAATGYGVRRDVLPGGVRVVSERLPACRSMALGLWVDGGSRDEPAVATGATHFLEHLLFKGTERRSAGDIATELDALGGGSNAYTTKEYTAFCVRGRADHLPAAVDVLTDMVTGSLLAEQDIERERTVIAEELAGRDDNARDLVHDLFAERLFGDSPLGRPVLGTIDSLLALDTAALRAHHRRHYRGADLVVSAAGDVRHEELMELLTDRFAGLPSMSASADEASTRRRASEVPATAEVIAHPRDIGQAALVLGLPGLSAQDERRWPLRVLNEVFGGGMSSRLFQRIRERHGLSYSVGSMLEHWSTDGLFAAYAACPPEHAERVVEMCREELAGLVRHGIDATELRRAVDRLCASLVLAGEGANAVMSRLARAELRGGEQGDIDDRLAALEAVGVDDVVGVAAELTAVPLTGVVVGPFEAERSF